MPSVSVDAPSRDADLSAPAPAGVEVDASLPSFPAGALLSGLLIYLFSVCLSRAFFIPLTVDYEVFGTRVSLAFCHC